MSYIPKSFARGAKTSKVSFDILILFSGFMDLYLLRSARVLVFGGDQKEEEERRQQHVLNQRGCYEDVPNWKRKRRASNQSRCRRRSRRSQ